MSKSPGPHLTLASGILACLVLSLSIQAMAAPPELINQSGQRLGSLFEGLKTVPFQPWARNHVIPKPWDGRLRTRLPGLFPVVIYGGGNCPGWEECSGSYTSFRPNLGGCDTGDGESCDVYDFYYDPNAECSSGEAQAYCGEFCCVSAFPCTNYQIVCP